MISGLPKSLFIPSVYGLTCSIWSSQARGQIRAAAAGLHRSHSNTRSLTHWLRPGIKPAFLGTWWDPTLLSHNGNSLLCIICGRIIMQKLKVCQGFIVPDFKNLSYDVRFFFFSDTKSGLDDGLKLKISFAGSVIYWILSTN